MRIAVVFLISIVTGCLGQNRYFIPEDIVDKTEEYITQKRGWIKLEDKIRVDGYTRIGNSIYGGEIACNIDPLQDIDVNTFEVIPGTGYARDKNHVYYPLSTLCVDYTDCGVCYYTEIIVKSADPASFNYLGKEYAIDDNSAFFRGIKIPEADVKSFRIIEGPKYFYFAVDSNNFYLGKTVFKEDPTTFYYDSTDERNKIPELDLGTKMIIGDKNHEWEYTPPSLIEEIKN